MLKELLGADCVSLWPGKINEAEVLFHFSNVRSNAGENGAIVPSRLLERKSDALLTAEDFTYLVVGPLFS